LEKRLQITARHRKLALHSNEDSIFNQNKEKRRKLKQRGGIEHPRGSDGNYEVVLVADGKYK